MYVMAFFVVVEHKNFSHKVSRGQAASSKLVFNKSYTNRLLSCVLYLYQIAKNKVAEILHFFCPKVILQANIIRWIKKDNFWCNFGFSCLFFLLLWNQEIFWNSDGFYCLGNRCIWLKIPGTIFSLQGNAFALFNVFVFQLNKSLLSITLLRIHSLEATDFVHNIIIIRGLSFSTELHANSNFPLFIWCSLCLFVWSVGMFANHLLGMNMNVHCTWCKQ